MIGGLLSYVLQISLLQLIETFSGWLADKMGRKGALLFNNLFAFIAAALMGSAKFVVSLPLRVGFKQRLGRLLPDYHRPVCDWLQLWFVSFLYKVNTMPLQD